MIDRQTRTVFCALFFTDSVYACAGICMWVCESCGSKNENGRKCARSRKRECGRDIGKMKNREGTRGRDMVGVTDFFEDRGWEGWDNALELGG